MKLYIECFRADGSQILGNLDGQAVIWVSQYRPAYYKRTNAYKNIKDIVGNPKWMDGKVHEARIIDENGKVVETIKAE